MTDRELDALVAEKAMGWKRCGDGDNVKPLHVPSKDRPGSIYDDWDQKGPHPRIQPPDCEFGEERDRAVFFCGCESRGEIPPYSTDIAAAWTVVEEMRRKGHDCEISIPEKRERKTRVAFVSIQKERDAEDASPPRAICLAALRALGVEVQSIPEGRGLSTASPACATGKPSGVTGATLVDGREG